MAKKTKRKLSKNRYSESYKDKDKGGSSKKGIYDFKKAGYDNVKFFKPKEKLNKIVIVPYEITSKLHPLVKSGRAEIGDLDYIMDVFVHRYMGPDNADILCPKKTYGKPCPLCDMGNALYNDGDKDAAKEFYASRRATYNVLAVEKGELSEELQVFDVSHFLFEKELIEEANDCSDGDDIIPFADLEDGSIIKFRMSIDKNGQYETPKYKSFDFLDREEELNEALVDEAVSFDKALVLLTPDEIMALYNGADDDDEEEDEKPKKSSKKKKIVEDDDEDDDEEEEEEKPKKPKRKPVSKKKVIEEDDEDEEDEDEEEEPPKKPKRKPVSKKKKVVEDDDDEEDEDDDEDEKPKKSSQKGKSKSKPSKSGKKKKVVDEDEDEDEDDEDNPCPYGHTFGDDCDKFKKDCNRCDAWDACMEASEE